MQHAANTSVCNDIRLFIGELAESSVSLDTTNGAQGPKLRTGTIKISWQDDVGENCKYELENVVYNPNSPFNILSVGRVGELFGCSDLPPSSEDAGNWCKSSTNVTLFYLGSWQAHQDFSTFKWWLTRDAHQYWNQYISSLLQQDSAMVRWASFIRIYNQCHWLWQTWNWARISR